MKAEKLTWKPSGERQASAPAWDMLEAPLKQVHTMRLKSFATGKPSENKSSFGTTVQPRRTPVNPAYLEKEAVSIATYTSHDHNRLRYLQAFCGQIKTSTRSIQKQCMHDISIGQMDTLYSKGRPS